MKKIIFNLVSAMYVQLEQLKQKTKENSVITNEKGDGLAAFIIIMLIVVVAGIALYNNYTGFMDELWLWAVNKVKSAFGI